MTIDTRFEEFHRANPKVYDDLVSMCRAFRLKGHKGKLGIGMLFEVLRWQRYLDNSYTDEFKLNNDYRSRYARKIMDENPELMGIFNIRDLRS